MKQSSQGILVLNAGSSSIKFALFTLGRPLQQTLQGAVEGIGAPGATLRIGNDNPRSEHSHAVHAPDYSCAIRVLLDFFDQRQDQLSLAAIGHRLVHGGPSYAQPRRITAHMLDRLEALSPLAPQHLPAAIQLIKAFQETSFNVPHVACFDTAFHHELPRVASLLPVPRRFEAQGVRKYGFHGLSYSSLMRELARVDGVAGAKGRVILAHLGSGASLAAVNNGRSIDTSMSFTPSGGVPMGTRSGDLDPGLLGYLARVEDLNADQLNDLVTAQSGLLGMSESSSDMRVLLERETYDIRAAEAIDVFCYQIKKWIGAFAAALGGVDTLVFAGGIGENAPTVRARICSGLAFLGIELDESRNAANAALVSAPAGRVVVRVMKTDEERTIAEMACELLDITPQLEIKP